MPLDPTFPLLTKEGAQGRLSFSHNLDFDVEAVVLELIAVGGQALTAVEFEQAGLDVPHMVLARAFGKQADQRSLGQAGPAFLAFIGHHVILVVDVEHAQNVGDLSVGVAVIDATGFAGLGDVVQV